MKDNRVRDDLNGLQKKNHNTLRYFGHMEWMGENEVMRRVYKSRGDAVYAIDAKGEPL